MPSLNRACASKMRGSSFFPGYRIASSPVGAESSARAALQPMSTAVAMTAQARRRALVLRHLMDV